jgi:hypothetical protein
LGNWFLPTITFIFRVPVDSFFVTLTTEQPANFELA